MSRLQHQHDSAQQPPRGAHRHHACGHHRKGGEAPAAAAAPAGATRLHVPELDCAAEESDIRRVLTAVSGIRSLGFEFAARTLTLEATPEATDAAVRALEQAGYTVRPLPATGSASSMPSRLPAGLPRLVTALGLATAAEAIGFFAPAGAMAWSAAGMGVALAAIALAGLEVYRKGLTALLRGRLNINALMAVAVSGAFVIGQWPEAAMVMALYAIAERIEARAVDRARAAIKGLMALAPEQAEVRQPDGRWLTLLLPAVPLGATVRVRPGGRVPLDGTVVQGRSAVDQAAVTGESLPVDKAPGDTVFAGTLNQTGTLEVTVSAPASESTLARIIHAVEQAQTARAPTQKFVDRFAAVYTPAVFVLALAVALLAPPLLGWGWLQALYKALVLLVIACPCALVISTPVTVVSGLTAAARRGILVKGGSYLEQARNLRVVALDKTGTITAGRPALVAWQTWGEADVKHARFLAAGLAGHSDHPVSKAIAAGLAAEQDSPPVVDVSGFTALPGLGVEAVVAGQRHALGNQRMIEERGQGSPELAAALASHERQGRTVTLLTGEQGVLALFAVADTIKPSSRQAVAELKALGVRSVMLSGDNEATARAVAAQAGVEEVRGNLLPADKCAAVEELRRRHGPSAMAGDGINDAPALARADIGFAMGAAGTDIAMEAADVVVMNDDLRRLGQTIRLSRRTHAVLWQNITLSLGIKAVFFALAVLGSASMWMAVFADMGASLLVVGNGLRLLRAQLN